MRPNRWQPTRLPRPWDSPGKNTGVGCHFLLQCMKGKSESEVAQSCPTPSDPMDCSLPGSSAHGIFQARVLEWGVIALETLKYQSQIIVNNNSAPFILNPLYLLFPKYIVVVQSLSHVQLCATPWTAAYQAPPSMGFSRQDIIASVLCFVFFGRETCEVLAPQPGIEPAPPTLEGEVLTTGPPGKSLHIYM